MEGLLLPPRITTGGGLQVQTGYERCLLFSFTASVIKELCQVLWSGNLYKFLCLCLGFGQYLGDILIIDILQINAYILTSRGTAIFLLQKFGFLGEFNIRPTEVLSKKNS